MQSQLTAKNVDLSDPLCPTLWSVGGPRRTRREGSKRCLLLCVLQHDDETLSLAQSLPFDPSTPFSCACTLPRGQLIDVDPV